MARRHGNAGQFSRWGPSDRHRPAQRSERAYSQFRDGVRLDTYPTRQSGTPARERRPLVGTRGSAKPAPMACGPANVGAAPSFSCGRGEQADLIMRISPGGGAASRPTGPRKPLRRLSWAGPRLSDPAPALSGSIRRMSARVSPRSAGRCRPEVGVPVPPRHPLCRGSGATAFSRQLGRVGFTTGC